MLVRADIIQVVQKAVGGAELLAPALSVSMSADDLEPFAMDAGDVSEIAGSLLENARRHARRRIEVTVGSAGGMVTVRVVDDGDGLPDELIERAFEPFVALDGLGGTGLGLSLSKALARAHGGDLVYDSRSRFSLHLPYTPV